jgi:predicted nucleic acid-binding protein
MLRHLQSDLAAQVLQMIPVDWSDVFQRSEALSARYTVSGRHRLADILHVATALHLGAEEFLTFDANQKKLAVAEGLKVRV